MEPMTNLITALSDRDFPDQLMTIHNLALYESGDALLGEQEKDALAATKHLHDVLSSIEMEDFLKLFARIA